MTMHLSEITPPVHVRPPWSIERATRRWSRICIFDFKADDDRATWTDADGGTAGGEEQRGVYRQEGAAVTDADADREKI